MIFQAEEGSEAQIYTELVRDLQERLKTLRQERQTIEEEQGDLATVKKNFEFFLACLKELPDTNAGGMPLRVNGLDVQGMQDLEECLLGMHENRSIGILISSHVIGELVKLCNRYLVMDHGRICMEYTREELLQQAGSEETVENYIITRFQKTM